MLTINCFYYLENCPEEGERISSHRNAASTHSFLVMYMIVNCILNVKSFLILIFGFVCFLIE